MKKIIIKYFTIAIAIEVALFSLILCSLNTKAEVPNSQKVVGHNATWAPYGFNFTGQGKYYTIDDSTGLSSSTQLAPTYFYTVDNEKFFQVNSLKLFTYVVNAIVGLVSEPNELNSWLTGFNQAINATDNENNKYQQNCLYDSNDNFLGYCLNDISGCYYGGNPPSNQNVKDDGNYSNNVRNYLDYADIDAPDYFTYYAFSNNYILSHLKTSLDSTQLQTFNEVSQVNNFLYMALYDFSTGKFEFNVTDNWNYSNNLAFTNDVNYLISNSSNEQWVNFCQECVENNECLATDLINDTENKKINIYLFDSQNVQITSLKYKNIYSNNNESQYGALFLNLGTKYYPFGFDHITVYRDSSIKNSLDSQLYKPTTYYTDAYKNYDVNQDNSINTSMSIVDNSIQNNSNIYNEASENYYNYYDNGYYDTSSATTNITNITNNYYSSGGSENPDNPDNPDNPSGTLDAILQALLRFFNAIGNIIGTVLAGLLNMIDAVLESIAGITENLTGLTDFFSAMLGWLPQPIPQILGIGISICIICAVVKFIRG